MERIFNDQNEALITDVAEAKKLAYAGNCTFTFVGASTRITYKIQKSQKGDRLYVKFLTGSDNQSDYRWLGTIMAYKGLALEEWVDNQNLRLYITDKINEDAASVKGIKFLHKVFAHGMQNSFSKGKFWHSDCCARCGRALTDPESIKRRLGPVCAGKA